LTLFTEIQPTLENHWRSIILFGRNVASYKFALGKSLLDLAQQGKEVVTLEELPEPFSCHICEHLQLADKQATSKSSRFLDACKKFNSGDVEKEELLDTTAKLGFVNVIDAFHIVHDGEIGVRFFTDERKGKEKGVRLTDYFFRLTEQYQYRNLPTEVEARWRLVETADSNFDSPAPSSVEFGVSLLTSFPPWITARSRKTPLRNGGSEAEFPDLAAARFSRRVHTAHTAQGLALDSLLWLVLQQVARHAEEGGSGGIRRAIGRGDHHFSQQPDVGDAHQASPVN